VPRLRLVMPRCLPHGPPRSMSPDPAQEMVVATGAGPAACSDRTIPAVVSTRSRARCSRLLGLCGQGLGTSRRHGRRSATARVADAALLGERGQDSHLGPSAQATPRSRSPEARTDRLSRLRPAGSPQGQLRSSSVGQTFERASDFDVDGERKGRSEQSELWGSLPGRALVLRG